MGLQTLLKRIAVYILVAYGLGSAYAVFAGPLGIPQGNLTPPLTLLAFAFALLHAAVSLGLPRTLLLVGLTFSVSLSFESVGVVTGWVYGPYHYTPKLGPMFLGLVPYLIPLAYFMVIYPAQAIAESFLDERWPAGWRRALGLAAASAVAMTAWDVLLDPLMVRQGFWVWDVPGGYFGVPLHNYVGWLATTFCVYLLYRVIEARLRPRPEEPEASFQRLAAWSYAVTWLGSSGAALTLGLEGPALAGAFSIGTVAVLGLLLVGRRPLSPLLN